MKIALVIVGVLLLVGLMLGGSLMSARNDLVTEREAVHGAWSQVDVVLHVTKDIVLGADDDQVLEADLAARQPVDRDVEDSLAVRVVGLAQVGL